MRWNLLDEVLQISRGRQACASAFWPQDQERPELYFLEMMAQTAGLIFGSLDDFQSDIVFAKVEDAQFYPVRQDHTPLKIQADAEDIRAEGGWFRVQVARENCIVAKARLLLANAGHLKPETAGSVTFHPHFMTHYQIRDRVASEETLL